MASKGSAVTLRGRFSPGTLVALVQVRQEALRAEGGKTVEEKFVDEDGLVRFTSGVEDGGYYFIVGVRERLRFDTPFWAKHCATILTDEKEPVRLVARPWQQEFDAALEKQRAAGMPMRAIVLKARKLGFSTWVQAKFVQRVTQLPFQYAIVAAQDRKTSGRPDGHGAADVRPAPVGGELGLGFSIRRRSSARADA
jgi:hypothetical protein